MESIEHHRKPVAGRFHDATGTGELTTPTGSNPKARVGYVTHYPDAVGREQAVCNYGTNGGTALTRSSIIPARSDTVLGHFRRIQR